MDENQQTTTPAQKSNLNPLLIVVILIIVGAVGVMLWLGSNKTGTESASTQVTPTTQTQEQKTESEATESATSENAMQQAITVEGGMFYFKPNEIRVKQGEKVTITFKNAGGMHDFILEEFDVKSEVIQAGETTTVEFTPDKKGSFEFYCSVGNHRQMGMKGTLIVE